MNDAKAVAEAAELILNADIDDISATVETDDFDNPADVSCQVSEAIVIVARAYLAEHPATTSEGKELPDAPGVWTRDKYAIVVFDSGEGLRYWRWAEWGWESIAIGQLAVGNWFPASALAKEVEELRAELRQASRETLELILKETNTTIEEGELNGRPFEILRMMIEERNTLRSELTTFTEEIGKLKELLRRAKPFVGILEQNLLGQEIDAVLQEKQAGSELNQVKRWRALPATNEVEEQLAAVTAEVARLRGLIQQTIALDERAGRELDKLGIEYDKTHTDKLRVALKEGGK